MALLPLHTCQAQNINHFVRAWHSGNVDYTPTFAKSHQIGHIVRVFAFSDFSRACMKTKPKFLTVNWSHFVWRPNWWLAIMHLSWSAGKLHGKVSIGTPGLDKPFIGRSLLLVGLHFKIWWFRLPKLCQDCSGGFVTMIDWCFSSNKSSRRSIIRVSLDKVRLF